nr:reverse transcriptase domain-containing protein [Tanacetum cinerariifolium]
MITILEKSEHNVDFHQIVDFVEASPIRIETTNEGTMILATIDGKPRTISESSIRRNLKLNDEEGISSLPDAELFENLALMGYNILPNQKFTFQKGFNEFSSNIATAVVCLATNRVYNFSKMIFDGMVRNVNNKGSKFLMYPRQYSRRATWIAQSKALPTAADEPASLLRDDSQGEAFPTVSGLEAGQDRENIIKTSALPHDSTPRVTSLDADEGKPSGDDALIKGRSMKIEEEARVERSTELGSNDTEKLVNVLTSMDAAKILTSEVVDVSVPPVAEVSTVSVPIVNRLVPTVSAIFTTASMVTPYSRKPREISAKDKGKEKMVKSDTPKKKKLQEQIDVQVAREMEEEMARDNQRINEQITRDAEIARIHAEEELKMMIDGLDRSNEIIAKHLQEGMTLEEIREKCIPVWKQIKDFVPMASKEEGQRVKRKGLKLEQGRAKKMKTVKTRLHLFFHYYEKSTFRFRMEHEQSFRYNNDGLVEVTNHGLKRILERTVGENRASWSDKLKDALWAFRTALKTSVGCTPYRLVYGKACHLPLELEHKAYWALKYANFDLKTAGDHRKLQLNELNELRDQAYKNSLIYKEQTKKLHDDKIKNRIFNVGDQVLLFNSRLKIFSGKLKSCWCKRTGSKTSEEVSEEDLKEMMQLVPVEEVYVEALQVKHPIIDWEIHSEGKRDYWKIIRL